PCAPYFSAKNSVAPTATAAAAYRGKEEVTLTRSERVEAHVQPYMSAWLVTAVAITAAAPIATAHAQTASNPVLGEIRTLATSTVSRNVIARLHHDGWLEARGQVLSTSAYPALFKAIGREWTPSRVATDQFAVPDVEGESSKRSSDNPYGVLGPGDLVT